MPVSPNRPPSDYELGQAKAFLGGTCLTVAVVVFGCASYFHSLTIAAGGAWLSLGMFYVTLAITTRIQASTRNTLIKWLSLPAFSFTTASGVWIMIAQGHKSGFILIYLGICGLVYMGIKLRLRRTKRNLLHELDSCERT